MVGSCAPTLPWIAQWPLPGPTPLLELELDELDELLLEEELLELELLDEELDEELDELLLDDEVLLELLDELLLDEELDELLPPDDDVDELVVGAYEHQADVVKLLAGKFALEHATLFVNVPYTKLPDFPRATWRVPLKEQVAPVFWAHLV